MLTTVLGKCGATIEADYIVDPKKDSRLGSLIRGRRGLFIAEAGKRPFDTQFLKILSGGDTMTVRPLYTDYQLEFPCNWNIVMTSNDAPRIDSYDEGLRQRLVAVPFLHRLDAGKNLSFTGHKRIEDARKDTNSPLLRGFFAWLIEGLNRLFLQDKNEPYLAPIVSEHTAKLLRDADPLTDFWDLYEAQNKLALSEGVQAADLHRSYSYWCETEKVRHIKRGKAFAAACRARGLVGHRTTHGVIWKKECRNVGKDPVLKSFPEIISHEDFPEKPTFLHSYIDSSNEDEIVEEGLFEVQGEDL
jgi:phage/plasmid-associated DNA primase